LERRITTLKVFFGWLAEMEYLPKDVAAPLIHHSITAPLADILNDAQLEAALAVTQSLRQGGQNRKPDARPHLLLTLILHTGIKKSECVALQLNHLELDAANPALWVRYKQSNRRHKERRIALPTWWPAVLQEYLDQHNRSNSFSLHRAQPGVLLTDVARQAEILRLTFEMLRWTCAAATSTRAWIGKTCVTNSLIGNQLVRSRAEAGLVDATVEGLMKGVFSRTGNRPRKHTLF
jgi:integrase/recombinase XerD